MAEVSLPEGVELEKVQKFQLLSDLTNIPDEDIKSFFDEVFALAKDKRRPHENLWKQCWDLYNGVYDWTEKADWQAKNNIPKIREKVDDAAAEFRRTLIRLKRPYGIETESKLGLEKGNFTVNLMDYWLDQADFINEFSKGLKAGLISSTMIFKVWWNYEVERSVEPVTVTTIKPLVVEGIELGELPEEKQELRRVDKKTAKLGFKAVDPFKFWEVPHMADAYIEEQETTVTAIQELAKNGIYNKEAVLEVSRSNDGAGQDDANEARRQNEPPMKQSRYVRPIKIYHYWGDILDSEGRILMRNATFTISQDGRILRKPRPNPFFHGKPPYIKGTPYVVPFSTYNRGMVEDIIGVATMITELSNLIIDGAQFDAVKAFEVDTELEDGPGELAKGLIPGGVYRKKVMDFQGDKKLITPIEVGKIPTEALAVLNFLGRTLDDAVKIQLPDNLTGQSIRTAAEVSARGSGTNLGLDDTARTIEETVINPMLDLVSKLIYQFHEDYSLPRLRESFFQTASILEFMSPADRYTTMVGDFTFKAKGISVMLDRAQTLTQVTQILELLSRIPGAIERINLDAMLEEVFLAVGWQPQKILVTHQAPMINPGASSQLTPSQIQSGREGAALGGAVNNPQARVPGPVLALQGQI
jgi:hypothetical protein